MESSTEGETDEHLHLMNLLMCQDDQSTEVSEENSRLLKSDSAELQAWPHIATSNSLDNVLPTSMPSLSINNMGLVTPADIFTNVQPEFIGKSSLQIAEEMNRQILKDELPMFPDSSDVTKLINTLPGSSLAPQFEQQNFDLTQNIDNLSNGNNLPLYGLMPNDSTDMEDPALSAVGLDFFESSDMIASSEKDMVEFNQIFQAAESKPKKDKKAKEKLSVPKKPSTAKKPVPMKIPEKTLTEGQVPIWAKAYVDLFKCQPWNFEAEKRFNERNSMKYPHCSICAILQPRVVARDAKNQKALDDASKSVIPARSVPEMTSIYKGRLNIKLKSETKESILLKCVSCRVCVHAFCYGDAEKSYDWMCNRCIKGDNNVTCCLCNLRGGALTLTTKNRWCHVVCAILNTDVQFTDSIRLGGIDVSNIPKIRKSMKCGYCTSFHKAPDVSGGIVQCTTAKCVLPFHVTCAHAAGVVFQPDTKHFPVFTMCHKHLEQADIRRKGSKRELAELQVGDNVISKHKNSRYYTCEIVSIQQELFCKAAFEDGSLSTNLYPEDFQNMDIRKDGPPSNESSVGVLWRPDGSIYNAIFKGTHYIPYYDIKFDDGSRVEDVTRDDIYTLSEKLPMKVKSKLSEITISTADESQTSGDRKRARQPNPLYFGRSYVKK